MTEAQTLTLTDFLLARIAEDAELAAAAVGRGIVWARLADGVAEHDLQAGWHVFRHDPARVLAECEAKRRIVERHSACDDVSYGDASTCPDMLDLASMYVNHPEFDPAWRLS